ncbi:MAG: hypothetical protein ACO34J_09100 [Prochlorothrix sp.]
MLDLSFYTQTQEPAYHISLPDTLWRWLAGSQFATIGQEQDIPITYDDETESLPLVLLESDTRQQFIAFFQEAIIQETRSILDRLNSPTPPQEQVLQLQKLIEILDCLKDRQYHYLQRY